MRAIVMAAGRSDRWHASGGQGPKHAIVIDGETLLARMQRQLAERGVSDVVVPQAVSPSVDGRLAVRRWWHAHERTVVLLGDTWYSDAAMDTIVGHGGPEPHLFARFGPSSLTGKPYGEPFANSFLPEHRAAHAASLRAVEELRAKGTIYRAGLWEAYKLDHGHLYPFNLFVANWGDATEIDDWTEDFDYTADLTSWLDRRQAVAA